MSAIFLGLVTATAAGGWIFMKMQQTSGYGNSTRSLKGASVAALVVFIIAFTIAKMLLH